MGYYDLITQGTGSAKRPQSQPDPFDPNTIGATQPPPFDPTSAQAQQAYGPPAAAPALQVADAETPGMPAGGVPAGMTHEGLQQMLRGIGNAAGGVAQSTASQPKTARPLGGYYAAQSSGDALARALMAVRYNNAPRR